MAFDPPPHDTLILDIRPREERWGSSIGFIPSSIHAPMVSSRKLDLTASIDLFQDFTSIALVCLSGHRSDYVQTHNPRIMGLPTSSIKGGVLAWKAANLPVAGLPSVQASPYPPPEQLSDLRRLLISCLMAETTETLLDHDLDPTKHDPTQIVDQAYEAEDVDPDSPTQLQLYRVFDRLALYSSRLGTDLKSIAQNIDGMLALLPDPT